MKAASYQVIVASVLERDGRFLCVEEMVNNVLRLNQPAGRLEVGETPVQGAVRETIRLIKDRARIASPTAIAASRSVSSLDLNLTIERTYGPGFTMIFTG